MAAVHWRGRYGFLLAAIGSAVGLGNIWRFSWLLGEHGGGAFLLVYVGAVLLLGLPLMLAEFALGRGTGETSPPAAFRRATGGRAWELVGYGGAIGCGLILSYYSVVAGWVGYYWVEALGGRLLAMRMDGFGHVFETLIGHPWWPVAWMAGVLALTAWIVGRSLHGGIERLCTTLMPMLAALLVGLAVYALNLPGSAAGVAFLLMPDWQALTRPAVYLDALGQAFFSMSVGYGIMLTYGAYAGRQVRLGTMAATIAVADTLFAVVAGLVIFPAVFSAGLDPASGPGLAFVTLPEVFARLPYGGVVAAAFFTLLFGAALTSTVSLLEVASCTLSRHVVWARQTRAWVLGAVIFVIGLPTAMVTGMLDRYDTVASSWLLPLVGLGTVLAVGWAWPRTAALKAAGLPAWQGRLWWYVVRYVTPAGIALTLLKATGAL